MREASYDLQANTQLTFETLRIGMAGLATEDYIDEEGASQHGPRTGLWLFFRDDPDQDGAVRVHPGQSLTRGGYRIDVLGINADPPGRVQLQLAQLPPVDAEMASRPEVRAG